MSEISLGELCEFIDHYLRLLEKEVLLLEETETRSQTKGGLYRDGFLDGITAMQEIVHIESELQLAWRQLEEVIAAMNWNPMIEEYCQKTIFEARSMGPSDSLGHALEIVQRRLRLQQELQKYLLQIRPDLLEDRFPSYIEKSFEARWERSLRRLRSA